MGYQTPTSLAKVNEVNLGGATVQKLGVSDFTAEAGQ